MGVDIKEQFLFVNFCSGFFGQDVNIGNDFFRSGCEYL